MQSFDLETGKREWIAEAGTSAHSTSLYVNIPGLEEAILTGRGGLHEPFEKPYGLSLVSCKNGATIWDLEIEGYLGNQNAAWSGEFAGAFTATDHLTINLKNGKIMKKRSLVRDFQLCHQRDGRYVMEPLDTVQMRKAMTLQSNCLVGNYHYFLAHDRHWIGRINVKTQKVEYLQVPVQVIREPGADEVVLWENPLENDMLNADGFKVTDYKPNASSGWGHISAASPVVIGDKIYISTMIGMVYVLKWNADVLNQDALLSISDLGKASETWSLSSLSYSDGRIYARTLKELICIGVR